MLSNATLERVSFSYRRGYRDGYEGANNGAQVSPDQIKPFADFDYAEGVKAGSNDRYWDDRRRAERNARES